MDGKVSNHAFGNKLLLAKLPDKDSILVGRYLSGDGKHPPPCKLGVADFKLHAARVRVCVGLAALVRVLSGVGGKPLLQVGVVGSDMDKGVFLVKPYIGGFFLLGKPCSHKSSFLRPCYAIGHFSGVFSGS